MGPIYIGVLSGIVLLVVVPTTYLPIPDIALTVLNCSIELNQSHRPGQNRPEEKRKRRNEEKERKGEKRENGEKEKRGKRGKGEKGEKGKKGKKREKEQKKWGKGGKK